MPASSPASAALAKDWRPAFFALFAGQALSQFGSAVVQFALIWHLTRTTGSATVLATASLAGILPMVLLGPFAGTFVDRGDRRFVMIAADSLIALLTLLLAAAFYLGVGAVWQIYLVMALRSAAGAFHGPAASASTALMVPKEHLARAAGLNQGLQGLNGILAPAVGALCLSFMSLPAIMLIDIATAALAVAVLAAISIPRPPAPAAPAGFWSDLRSGFRYIKAWPAVMILIGVAMALNFLLTPTGSLMPLLVQGRYGRGAVDLALAEACFGVGIISGGLLLGVWGGFRNRMATTALGLALMGTGTALGGLLPAAAFPVFLASMFLVGVSIVVTNGPIQAILQAKVEPGMQGRVQSLMGTGCMAIAPVALALAGPVTDRLGFAVWYGAAGVVCLAMAALTGAIKPLMDLGRLPAAAAGAAGAAGTAGGAAGADACAAATDAGSAARDAGSEAEAEKGVAV
jgi:DHA3 family macrolide efflux protein-like MFS transporter